MRPTGEHCPLFDYELPEDLKPDLNYSRPTHENRDLQKLEPQTPAESCLSATGHGSLCEQASLYSAYDHLLCESRPAPQQSQPKLVNDLFQEAADALLHEAIASGITENIPTVSPLGGTETEFSIPVPEVKTEKSSDVNDTELVTNASSDCTSDPACCNISSQNLSTILGEEVSGFINSFAESIPSSFSAGLFNNSDLNISLNEFDFEGFPEEPQVVNDNGPQSVIFKEENTTDTQELSLGDSPFFFSDLDIKNDDFANQSTEQHQRSKRARLNASKQLEEDYSSVLTTRTRRPSSSASSGHGTLSDDSEGDIVASNQPSASSLAQAFDLFNSIVNNNSDNLDTSSSNSGGGNFNSGSDLADLGIGPESVDLGSLASLNCLNSSLDEMIQASYQHNRASQIRAAASALWGEGTDSNVLFPCQSILYNATIKWLVIVTHFLLPFFRNPLGPSNTWLLEINGAQPSVAPVSCG
ncbi:hypothetical protein FHG87_005924 [Trinorchestia longiramus]|nr:hypothetical protein FHG87_005924 [Trinorchestia longiramus]